MITVRGMAMREQFVLVLRPGERATAAVVRAATEKAIRRMVAGEVELAYSRRCGTSLLVAMLLVALVVVGGATGGLVAGLAPQAIAVAVGVAALIAWAAARPLGLLAQRVATVSTRFRTATVLHVTREVEADGNRVTFAVDVAVDAPASADQVQVHHVQPDVGAVGAAERAGDRADHAEAERAPQRDGVGVGLDHRIELDPAEAVRAVPRDDVLAATAGQSRSTKVRMCTAWRARRSVMARLCHARRRRDSGRDRMHTRPVQRRLVYLVAAASCAGTVVACEHPSGPGLAPDAYRIVEVGVEVEPTTRRGRPWDDAPGELPDLEIRIRIDDRVGGSCKLPDDQTRGRCKLDLAFQLEPDTRIRLDVVDRDTLVDDPIGTAALTDPSSWSVALPLPLQPAGRLRAATVVLRRPPTLWDRHRGRLIGLGVGVALALAALWTFRGGLLAAAPRPAPTPRCTHCGVFLGMDTSRCTHCGAAQKEAVG